MLPKRSAIRAATIAVLASYNAIGAAVSPYAPAKNARTSVPSYGELNGGSHFDAMMNETYCSYGDAAAHAQLSFYVGPDYVSTWDMDCPKDGKEPAFRAYYTFIHHLWQYEESRGNLKTVYRFEDKFPPENTGWDLLYEMDESPFNADRNGLYAAARQAKFQLPTADAKFKGVCSAVIKAVESNFGPLKDLCAEVRSVYKDARSVAKSQGWVTKALGNNVKEIGPA
ncbi:hypothetical protein FOZ63_031985 [Perkinsus olseni]|uniref:Uncharacterized protein n=1 Tax=Perkinsus olseni TaxID=32597 RepID=A0A7J6UGW7_PEROL|nr:hypothetical protein FOZ63_031985 [Perkinsus olseni]